MSARTFRDSHAVDFVIVGSGAAGGVLARVWPSDLEHDELKNWFLGGLATRNPQTFRRSAA